MTLTGLGSCLLVALLGVGGVGCRTDLSARRAPGAKLDPDAAIYVVRDDSDPPSAQLEEVIVHALARRGVDASGGAAADIPPTVAVVARYDCQWQWDMSWYLLDLRIALHEHPSDLMIVTGRSMRTSLVREPPSVMVNEVVQAILREGTKP